MMEVAHFTTLEHLRVKTLERGRLYYICTNYTDAKVGYGGAHCEFVLTLSGITVAPQRSYFINEHGEREETGHMQNDFPKIFIQPIPLNLSTEIEPRWVYSGTMGVLENEDPYNYVLSHHETSKRGLFVDITRIPSKRRPLWKS